MFFNPGVNPNMPWAGQAVAKNYMRQLSILGHVTMTLIGSKLVRLPTSTYLDLEMHILTLRIASRHIPEAGAVCGSSARTDLCGGRQVTAVPTATVHSGRGQDHHHQQLCNRAVSYRGGTVFS
jgi:hypothetical protein